MGSAHCADSSACLYENRSVAVFLMAATQQSCVVCMCARLRVMGGMTDWCGCVAVLLGGENRYLDCPVDLKTLLL